MWFSVVCALIDNEYASSQRVLVRVIATSTHTSTRHDSCGLIVMTRNRC